jgi:hypothetical protein
METMGLENLAGVMIAVGLAAACGFRVFVPPFVVGLLHAAGQIELSESVQWISSPIALVAFGGAMTLEIVAYFVPVVDNVLDTVATPAAVVAGIVMSASVMTDLSPVVQWSIAAILGVGVTAPVQAATAALRGAATLTSAGIGNPLLAAGEMAAAGIVTALGIFAPVVGLVVAAVCLGGSIYLLYRGMRWLRRTPAGGIARPAPPSGP